jgi:ABC-2 type transport system ATP-binding protein
MTEMAIRLEELARDFGPVRAVDNLSLEVSAGIIFGFLGPNGAGKTTTIRMLLGLLEPTHGKAEVLGFETSAQADKIRTHTGVLLEHSGIYEHLSAEENLEFYGRIWNLSASERRSRIKELLTQIGLWERRSEPAGKWSKGMKQKLALARALLHHPTLLLLDEPTAGLDVISAVAVRDDLAALVSREGVTVFLTTHNMVEAERLCSQVAVIRKGSLVAMGSPDDLRAQAGDRRVEIVGRGLNEKTLALLRARPDVVNADMHADHLTIELQQEAEVAPLVSLLVGEGVQVEEVLHGKASLEDVFVTLMEEEK